MSLFVLILVVIGIAVFNQSRRQGAGSAAVRRRPDLGAARTAAALAVLRQHDPAFDEAAFAARVRLAFAKIQAAWCAQDLRAVRAFISDGVYERFSLQFAEQKAEGYRDHMEAIRVDDVRLAAVSSPGVFDELTVRIAAAAKDWRESLVDGSRVSGSKAVEPFAEYWTFLRRRGAVTDVSRSGLIEGNCPNCGASIEMNQAANCANCQALLRSGEYDWVLAEITQQSVWQPPSGNGATPLPPGVAELRRRDPDFDVAALEDRASVIYWRKATADRTGKIDALAKVALPQFAQAYAASALRPHDGQPRPFVADTAVGSVETVGVFADQGWDFALVLVKWSGSWFTANGDGRIQRTDRGVYAETLYVLARQHGARSDAGRGVSSAHCPQCGAPESAGASNACEFCGTVLNDGSRGWVLHDVRDRRDPAAREWWERIGTGHG